MDDVGQTLLNWAAAFGTYEMVCASHTAPSLRLIVEMMYGYIPVAGFTQPNCIIGFSGSRQPTTPVAVTPPSPPGGVPPGARG